MRQGRRNFFSAFSPRNEHLPLLKRRRVARVSITVNDLCADAREEERLYYMHLFIYRVIHHVISTTHPHFPLIMHFFKILFLEVL